jgi:A/G-specific adenine glycosylase
MDTRQKAAFRRTLLRWYRDNRRALPWRRSRDPYRIWVSEVMLQQTRVETVIPYYRRFLARFPNLKKLSRARLNTVLKQWEGLGYYARARNLHAAARMVVREHRGRIPDDPAAFRRLPGVGDYIAGAVLSIAHDLPLSAVDGNVKRVLSRLFCCATPVNLPAAVKRYRRMADALLDARNPGDFNQAMMELGALTCTPRDPGCPRCPVRRFCKAFRSERVSRFPRRQATGAIPTRRVAVGVVFRGKRVLITRRATGGLLGGLWEFPGGKIRRGESARAACRREVAEETGIAVEVLSRLARVSHAYTHFRVKMEVFYCRYLSGEVRLKGPVDHRWIIPGKLDRFPLPGANRKFVPLIGASPGG